MKDRIKSFYDEMANQYDMLFEDWSKAVEEQNQVLSKLLENNGFDRSSKILDCACGIGTQAIGLALIGYDVTASDLSDEELKQAQMRAKKRGVDSL